jgi:hypothetical protein
MVSQLKVRGTQLQLAPNIFAHDLGMWLEAGLTPSSQLLGAILENDLSHAIALTGPSTWPLVHATLVWLWNFAPTQCYGSKAAVDRWQRAGGMGRLQ